MSHPVPLPAQQFGRRLFRLGQRWRREIDGRMRGYGLTDATWRPLLILGRDGDGMRQTDLAAALDIEGASLVRVLDTLERDGLIRRCADPADRRTKTLRMTEQGQAVFRKVFCVYESVSRELLAGLDAAQIGACLAVFDHLDGALDRTVRADPAAQPPG